MKELFQAVHRNDVQDFFKNIGLLERLTDGSLQCCSCADVITADNFRAVTKYNGKLLFSCSKEICFIDFISCLEGRQ